MKTLEQVIEEFLVSTEESAAIAEAVRGWMEKEQECSALGSRPKSDKFPYDIHDHLISTEPLYAWANKRIEMLEEENKRIKELEAEVARLASLKSSPGCCDKAAKYDSICEQFPYMPGAVVWILQDGAIQRATVWRIGERVARVLLDEIAIDVDPSRLHPTADACRAAIPVEE